ncbi:MAG: histidine phosphatase family protein [Pseudomonadota bacterium]|nr:MAG: histidine phosphatase family protein [Pseudomonadota bacterium]
MECPPLTPCRIAEYLAGLTLVGSSDYCQDSEVSPVRFRALLIALTLCIAAPWAAAQSTTVFVVRHAEKTAEPADDPELSSAGHARAEALAGALADAGIDAIISTQYRRTRDTVAPLARRIGKPVEVIEWQRGDVATQAESLAHRIGRQHAGQQVLVAGHSNTVPAIVAALSGHSIRPISEQTYGQLFIVQLDGHSPGRLIRARFGTAP